MLSYTREKYGNQTINNNTVDNSEILSENNTYGHTEWMRDFNNSHAIGESYEDTSYYDGLSGHDAIYEDSTSFAYDGSLESLTFEDTAALESDTTNTESLESTDSYVSKKRTLSNKAKVHIVIYAALLVFVISMIIANAWIAGIERRNVANLVHAEESNTINERNNNMFFGSDGKSYSLEDVNINIYSDNTNLNNTNSFDNFCDTLDGNK